MVPEKESEERKRALHDVFSSCPISDQFLKSSKTGEHVTLAKAFSMAIDLEKKLTNDLVLNGPGKKVKLHVKYTNDEDHFVIETSLGPMRVETIIFEGEIYNVNEILVPISMAAEYRRTETKETISQLAAFATQDIHGEKFSMEMHRMGESGKIYIIMRKVRDNS